MTELIFFESQDVKITNARFVSGSQTYAMSNVTSVRAFEQKPKRFWGIFFLLVGLVAVVNAPIVGLLIAITAAVVLLKQKTIYHVILATSGGETSALTTHQQEYLQNIVSALNEAIVHRG